MPCDVDAGLVGEQSGFEDGTLDFVAVQGNCFTDDALSFGRFDGSFRPSGSALSQEFGCILHPGIVAVGRIAAVGIAHVHRRAPAPRRGTLRQTGVGIGAFELNRVGLGRVRHWCLVC